MNESGFSLIEVAVASAIIAVLTATAATQYLSLSNSITEKVAAIQSANVNSVDNMLTVN